MDDDELLISKPEVYLYEIPPGKASDADHRAADWDVAHPAWQGKILIYMAGPSCHIQLDDQQGNIYAQSVIDEYPGQALKLVSDSRRYFTLNVQNVEGKFRLVGIGFTNREDSSEISSILKGYFAAAVSRKRKIDKRNNELNDASPTKKVKSSRVELIYSETNDPNYKYIRENKFQCHECPISFDCPDLMVQHWKQIHKLKKAGLCLCKLPFVYRGERMTHNKMFHENDLPCGVCENRFRTQEDVVEHLRKVHRRNADSKPIGPGNDSRVLKCSHCDQDYFTKLQLINHFRDTHTIHLNQASTAKNNETKQINGNMNKSSSKADYQDGINLPTASNYPYLSGNLFQCQKCTETFKDIRKLAGHWIDVHKIKVKYCNCNWPFPNLENFQVHRDKFHNLLCYVCNAGFINESRLEEHLLKDHLCDYSGKKINSLDKAKFQCEHCEAWFSYGGLLRRHVKSKHEDAVRKEEELKSVVESLFTSIAEEHKESFPSTSRSCTICAKIFFTENERFSHYQYHFSDKPGSKSTEVTDEGNLPKIIKEENSVKVSKEEEKATFLKVGLKEEKENSAKVAEVGEEEENVAEVVEEEENVAEFVEEEENVAEVGEEEENVAEFGEEEENVAEFGEEEENVAEFGEEEENVAEFVEEEENVAEFGEEEENVAEFVEEENPVGVATKGNSADVTAKEDSTKNV